MPTCPPRSLSCPCPIAICSRWRHRAYMDTADISSVASRNPQARWEHPPAHAAHTHETLYLPRTLLASLDRHTGAGRSRRIVFSPGELGWTLAVGLDDGSYDSRYVFPSPFPPLPQISLQAPDATACTKHVLFSPRLSTAPSPGRGVRSLKRDSSPCLFHYICTINTYTNTTYSHTPIHS